MSKMIKVNIETKEVMVVTGLNTFVSDSDVGFKFQVLGSEGKVFCAGIFNPGYKYTQLRTFMPGGSYTVKTEKL